MASYIGRALRHFRVEDDPDTSDRYVFADTGDDVPRYRLYHGDDWLLGSGDPAHVVDHLFWHVNRDTFAMERERVLIHAGAVTGPGGAIILPAGTGSGKSTLVAALVSDGFGYLSDEAAAIGPGPCVVNPLPLPLHLKDSKRLFPDLAPADRDERFVNSSWRLDPERLRPGCLADASEARLVVFPSFEPDVATCVEPLTRPEACVRLVGNTMNFAKNSDEALPVLRHIAERSRSFALTYSNSEDAVEAIRGLNWETM